MRTTPTEQVRLGVTDTLLDYCQFVDEKRLDEFASLFTLDCHFDEGAVYEGRPAVRRVVGKLVAGFSRMSHHLSNIRVWSTAPGEAEALSYIYAWHERTDGTQFEIWGRYADVLVDDGDRWRFRRRVVMAQGSKGIENLPIRAVPLQET